MTYMKRQRKACGRMVSCLKDRLSLRLYITKKKKLQLLMSFNIQNRLTFNNLLRTRSTKNQSRLLWR